MDFSKTAARPLHGGTPAADKTSHKDLFRLVTDNLTDHCIFVLDTEGEVETWSACAERLTGYTEQEAVGRSIAFLNLPLSEGDGGHLNDLAEARSAGRSEAKRVWVTKDGRHVRVEEVTTPLRQEGELVGYVIIARDLDQRQEGADEGGAYCVTDAQSRAELAAADRRAAFLAEASSILVASSLNFDAAIESLARLAVSRLSDWCVIYAVGDDGKVRRIEAAHSDPRQEPTLRQLLGAVLEKRRHHPILSVIQTGQSELLEEVPESVKEALASGADQMKVLRKLGMRSAIFTPLIARGRALGGLTLVSTRPDHTYDDDDLKLAEELARRAAIAIDNARLYREAQEANRAKADFLAIVSHELRTPLNAIMGYSDLLDTGVSGPVTPQQRRQLGRVRASARHLLQLIEEILNYARIESGGAEIELREGTIEEITEDVLAIIEPLAVAKNLRLTKQVESGGATLRTDGAKVRQVLVNLLSNAVKFTEHGHIDLLAGTKGDRAFFTIRDTGVGIGAEQLGKIFDAFWQVERPNTRRVGGTGLGLSVAQRFARLLRGELTVQSEAGRGSTFTLTLPLTYEEATTVESAAA